jgi:hypothetical protein
MTQSIHYALALTVYTHVDYAGEAPSRKSIGTATVYLNGLLVSRYCTKQNNAPLSKTEPEFFALSRGVQEIRYKLPQELVAPRHSLCNCSWTVKRL